MSRLRKIYFAKLVFRVIILGCIIGLYITNPIEFDIILRWNFFDHFSPLHILYAIWLYDMINQLIPKSKHIALGSQKLFKYRFRDITEGLKTQTDKLKETLKEETNRLKQLNYEKLREYVINTTKKAYKVFAIWISLIVMIGILYFTHIISHKEIFIISTLFFVCDLICVLIWCPFRLLLGNKCCTTCRIFNWDHLMMFLPFVFIPGIFTTSILLLSIAIWLVWEIYMMIHPERFWQTTNVSLRCSECTDKLCTQYCKKLRK